MIGFPLSVTRDQVLAALEVLGVPADHVISVQMDCRKGVTVRMHVTDDAGRKQRHGNSALKTELRIPYGTTEQEAST